MRAMISELARGLPDHEFTIIHQFSDPQSEVELDVPVDYLDLRLPVLDAMRLALFAVFTLLGVRVYGILGRKGRYIVDRYSSARLTISAPGGPYFGDIYADHEAVHWFYVWLARRMNKPVFLYAPSVGPFEKTWLNPLRRRGFTWFDAITLRDEVSAHYLSQLLGRDAEFEVTADSALQETIASSTPEPNARLRLAVSIRDPGPEMRSNYEAAVLSAIEAVCSLRETDVIFLPQLHGPRHSDQLYLEAFATRIQGSASTTVESGDDLDSRGHRQTIAEADLVIAGRYHPAVFAVAGATPALVIPYEHKSWGLARQAGIEAWTVDFTEATDDRLVPVILDLLDRSEEVEAILKSRRLELHRRALRTSDIAIQLAHRT